MPVYNAEIELLKDGKVGYIYQPCERLVGTPVIQPGDTFWADYVLVPWIPGPDLDLARAFVRRTGGNVSLDSTIIEHPALPGLDAYAQPRGRTSS